MAGNEWIRVAKIADVPDGSAVALDLDGRSLALFHSGSHFYAIDNLCPHKGGPLAEGSLENGQVTCSWHAWTFDVRTGQCETVPGVKIGHYPVKIKYDEVFIKL